jgi:hypothetical protein
LYQSGRTDIQKDINVEYGTGTYRRTALREENGLGVLLWSQVRYLKLPVRG